MRKTKMVEINGDALRFELARKGYTMAEASRAIGMSNTYMKNRITTGTMTQSGTMLIEHYLGIPLANYVSKVEETPKQVDMFAKADIYDAVKEALKDAEIRETYEIEIKRDKLIDALIEALLDPDVLSALEKEFFHALRGMGVREVVR